MVYYVQYGLCRCLLLLLLANPMRWGLSCYCSGAFSSVQLRLFCLPSQFVCIYVVVGCNAEYALMYLSYVHGSVGS